MRHVKLFEAWINEATTEASTDELQKLLTLIVPIIKKSVSDTVRFELEFAKKLSSVKNDNERSKLFNDLDAKKTLAEKPISTFLSSKGKISQSQFDKIISWSKTMKDLLFKKEMYSKENEFKSAGADVSKWKEMYSEDASNNEMLLINRNFAESTGLNPPIIT